MPAQTVVPADGIVSFVVPTAVAEPSGEKVWWSGAWVSL